MGVAFSTMKLALNEDCYQLYKRCKSQLLTEKSSGNRLIKTKKLLNKMKHPGTIWFFYIKKNNFYQDTMHNTNNNRWYASYLHNVPCVMNMNFPQIVMVFFGGGVSSTATSHN